MVGHSAGAASLTSPLTGVGLTSGSLRVSLADEERDIDAVQALRYRVFYSEMAAHPTLAMERRARDYDRYDHVCDHLLVRDMARSPGPQSVVGTYRLIRRQAAELAGGFYSSGEYNIQNLIDYPGEILELGRSCVDFNYRTGATLQLLWRGITAYIIRHQVTLMFGCASLRGTDISAIRLPLSYLYFHHLAPEWVRPVALAERRVDMRLVPPEEINPHSALGLLPPLVKGYLRLGGFVGDGAVIDQQFDTTDVCVVVDTNLLKKKYLRHFFRPARDGDMI